MNNNVIFAIIKYKILMILFNVIIKTVKNIIAIFVMNNYKISLVHFVDKLVKFLNNNKFIMIMIQNLNRIKIILTKDFKNFCYYFQIINNKLIISINKH